VPPTPSELLARLADLAVVVGANVQPGQVVSLSGRPGQEELVRALADSAYRHGARYVDLTWFDPHIKRSRLLHAPEDSLEWVPPWLGRRASELGDMAAAAIGLAGPTAPGLLDDVDPARAGRDRLPSVKEGIEAVMAAKINWTVVPCPNPAWAALVFPDLDPEAALARLWQQIGHICRLDEDDPAIAWRARGDQLRASADRLNGRRLDALRFVGPGTDLRVGLLPGSRWVGGREQRRDGLEHLPNIPTEEVFTTPDPLRTEGHVTSTRPLDVGGTVIEGLRVRFEAGRAVEIEADSGAEVLRRRAAVDEGAARLGEVALVDGSGRIGPLGTVFFDTLLDENATSHIAIGAGYPMGAPDEGERINQSEIHIDFMIGGPEVTVFGIDSSGTEFEVLRDGDWFPAPEGDWSMFNTGIGL
jgi:aminopeptidase